MNPLIHLMIYYGSISNFDPMLLQALGRQESNMNPRAVGALGELGIFQLRPEFLPDYSKNELLNPEINVKVAIKLLKEAKKNCIHKKNFEWLVCFNMGVTRGNKIKYPTKNKYVINVTKYYKEYKNERNYACKIQETRKRYVTEF